MHLSKKKKFTLMWFVPFTTVAAVGAIAATTFVLDEKNQNKLLGSVENIDPIPFSNLESNGDMLEFDPKDFSAKFFLYNIGNSVWLNDVFEFRNGTEKLEKIILRDLSGNITKIYWKDKMGVTFEIIKMSSDLVEIDGKYIFDLLIEKNYRKVSSTYSRTITITSDSFANEDVSEKNFNSKIANSLNDVFASQDLKISVSPNKLDKITSIDQITSSGDLTLVNSSFDILVETTTLDDVRYLLKDNEFRYLGTNAKFLVPVTKPISSYDTKQTSQQSDKLIFNSDVAYKFVDGKFDTTSPLFKFLKEEYDAGRISYLPDLSFEESYGLNESAIIDRKIQKLIFDPNKNPYTIDSSNNKIPLKNYQAVVVKVELNQASTYIVTWTNLFETTSSIVTGASELAMRVGTNNGAVLTYSDLLNPKNYSYIIPIEPPKNGLIYQVIDVKFASSDIYKKNPIATVKVTSKEVNETKVYETNIISGFKSKAYVDMENQINMVIGDTKDLSKLVPIISLKTGVDSSDVINSDMSNMEQLSSKIDVKNPQNISQDIQYTPVFAKINGNILEVHFKISSKNDLESYWKVYGVEQRVVSKLNLAPQQSTN